MNNHMVHVTNLSNIMVAAMDQAPGESLNDID